MAQQDDQTGELALPDQASLESELNFSARPPLSPNERNQAQAIFRCIIQHSHAYESSNPSTSARRYKRTRVLESVNQHVSSLSEDSHDTFLRYCLAAMIAPPDQILEIDNNFSQALITLSSLNDYERSEKEIIMRRVIEFGDHLIECVFLPLRACGGKTPEPKSHFTPGLEQGDPIITATSGRLSALRALCLQRDKHRCVISHQFDASKEKDQLKRGMPVIDDDGNPLAPDDETRYLEVAHIIPHAITAAKDNRLRGKQIHVLQILNMFSPGITRLLEGTNIDRPSNALTLTMDFHQSFGRLEVYFEAIPSGDNEYIIRSILPIKTRPRLPVQRELLTGPNNSLSPPSPQLLALHRACCLILHESGAAEYIDKVLEDRDLLTAETDGSTELGGLVTLGLLAPATLVF